MSTPIVKVVHQADPLPWRVQASNNPYPSMSMKSKGQAVLYARHLAKSVKGVLKIQGIGGRFMEIRNFGPPIHKRAT